MFSLSYMYMYSSFYYFFQQPHDETTVVGLETECNFSNVHCMDCLMHGLVYDERKKIKKNVLLQLQILDGKPCFRSQSYVSCVLYICNLPVHVGKGLTLAVILAENQLSDFQVSGLHISNQF